MNQIGDRFPSDDEAGDANYSTSYLGDDYSILNIIAEITHPFPAGSVTPYEVSKYAFRYTIRAVAGLYYWFAVETGMLYEVTVKNDFSAGVVLVDGNSYPSGAMFGRLNGAPITVSTNSPQANGGYDRYFREWQKLNPDESFVSSNAGINWSTTVNGNHIYKAKFNRMISVTVPVASYVEPGSGGLYRVNGTDVGSSWQGTFLENSSTPIELEAVPPGGGWFFAQWSDDNVSNPRYLSPTSHTSIYAIYKMTLASTTANATAINSQRLVAGMGLNGADDRYFMVYPSGGDLWTNGSLDNGTTWSNEMRVTDGLGTSSAPSVALWTECTPGDSPNEDCDTELYTVYRKQSGSNYNIMFTTVLPFGTGVPASTQISSTAISTSIDARPVVVRLVEWGEYHTMWTFWQNADGIAYNYAELSGSTWNWVGEGLGFDGSFQNPTVSSVDLTVATPTFSLAYDNATDVFVFNHPTYTVDGAVPASVSPTSFSPQVCADNRTSEQVHVVWEAYGGEEPPPPGTDSGDLWETDGASQRHRVMYQQWSGTRWEAAHEFRNASIDYMRPTISNLANGNLAWAWDDGSSTYKALFDGSTWDVTEVYPSSKQPNLTISGSWGPIATTRFVSTSTSGAPYQLGIGSETTGPKEGPQASIVSEEYSRRVVVARKPLHRVGRLGHSSARNGGLSEGDSTSYVSVELSPIGLKMHDGTVVPVEFAAVGDSLLDENAIWTSLVSQPITLSALIDSVIISGEAEAVAPLQLSGTEIGLSFDVVDADRGTVLKRIGAERTFNSNTIGSLMRRDRVAALAGRRVFIRPSIRGLVGRSTSLVSTLVHVHTLLTDSISHQGAVLAKLQGEGQNLNQLPTVFALHQNYPNPFNPTTEIKFDMPDAGNVSMVVYDVLGKQVAELAGGYHAAGYHTARWNASNQSSGVYFARFTVTNAEGKTAFTRVNKLVLLR